MRRGLWVHYRAVLGFALGAYALGFALGYRSRGRVEGVRWEAVDAGQ
jgi:hypothetical protein